MISLCYTLTSRRPSIPDFAKDVEAVLFRAACDRELRNASDGSPVPSIPRARTFEQDLNPAGSLLVFLAAIYSKLRLRPEYAASEASAQEPNQQRSFIST